MAITPAISRYVLLCRVVYDLDDERMPGVSCVQTLYTETKKAVGMGVGSACGQSRDNELVKASSSLWQPKQLVIFNQSFYRRVLSTQPYQNNRFFAVRNVV